MDAIYINRYPRPASADRAGRFFLCFRAGGERGSTAARVPEGDFLRPAEVMVLLHISHLAISAENLSIFVA
ncbi:hypothetical protein, partial [Chromobacterium subtsugae]|uniref:hypothetical protein n=1 Tax=Chromobacterium subtsugae TaxID=251747 RepID=UPI001F20D3E4